MRRESEVLGRESKQGKRTNNGSDEDKFAYRQYEIVNNQDLSRVAGTIQLHYSRKGAKRVSGWGNQTTNAFGTA